MQCRYVFRRKLVIYDHRSKRNNRSFKWYSEPPLIRCLPIRQQILYVSQIAVTFPGIRPPFLIQTWLQQYRRCPFFHSAHRSLGNPICFWSMWCRRAMIPGEIFTSFAKFHGIVSVNDSRIPIGLQELLQASLCLLWSFVLHGYDCTQCVAKSCTTTAYRWLFRDSHPSLRTVWSAVFKSHKISTLGTSVPVRLPARSPRDIAWEADIAISVLREVRKMLCLPHTIFARGSKGHSWEELEASRCSGTLSCKSPCLNACSQSGTPCNWSLCNSSSSSFLFGFSVSAGSCDGFPRSSSLVLPLLSGAGYSLVITVSCDEDVGEAGADEVGELVDKAGTTGGTWFAVLQLIFLPLLMRCGFLTTGPTETVPKFFAEFSRRKNCWCIFKKHCCHKEIQFFDVYRRFFFCWHLAGRIFRHPYGFQFDFWPCACLLKNLPQTLFPRVSLWMRPPQSTPQQAKRMQLCLPFLSLQIYLANSHASPRAHRSCLAVSPGDLSSNFKAWGLRWWRILTCSLPSDGPLFSRMFAWRSAAFVRRTRRELVPRLSCPSVKSMKMSAALCPQTRNRTVVHLSLSSLHCCHHPCSAFLLGCSSTFLCGDEHLLPNLHPNSDLENWHSGGCH